VFDLKVKLFCNYLVVVWRRCN